MSLSALSLDTVAIIGGGKMGEAILAGLLQAKDGLAGQLSAQNYIVVNPGQERRTYLNETYGVHCVASLDEVESASVVILAVKPQVFVDVLPVLATQFWVQDSLVLSIAAGISCASIEAALPENVAVARAMPNLPLTVGHGVMVFCAGAHVSQEVFEDLVQFFSCLGNCVVVEEAHMDAVTALSGSGPAYIAALCEALINAGVKAGLAPEVAETLAVSTAEGTGALMLQRAIAPSKLREDVCSPGGTTLAALEAMEALGYSSSIRAGVEAAIARSKELSQ